MVPVDHSASSPSAPKELIIDLMMGRLHEKIALSKSLPSNEHDCVELITPNDSAMTSRKDFLTVGEILLCVRRNLFKEDTTRSRMLLLDIYKSD